MYDITNIQNQQNSSHGIKPHIMIFTVLDFLQKVVPTSTMQSAVSHGEPVKILLVLQLTAIFCTDVHCI